MQKQHVKQKNVISSLSESIRGPYLPSPHSCNCEWMHSSQDKISKHFSWALSRSWSPKNFSRPFRDIHIMLFKFLDPVHISSNEVLVSNWNSSKHLHTHAPFMSKLQLLGCNFHFSCSDCPHPCPHKWYFERIPDSAIRVFMSFIETVTEGSPLPSHAHSEYVCRNTNLERQIQLQSCTK